MFKVTRSIDKYAETYNNLYPIVFSSIYHRIKNSDDAQDICQEVFTRFFIKFNEIENYRKWLLGAVKFVIIEYYRKNSNKNQIEVDEVIDDIQMSYVNGFKDTRLIIEEALNSDENYTDEKTKTLFELIAIQKFTYHEAAKELRLNKGQARYQYNLTVNRIIEYLKKRGIKSLEDLL